MLQGPGGYQGGNYGPPGGGQYPGPGPVPGQPPMDPAGYAHYQQQYYSWMQQQAQFNPQYAMQIQQYYAQMGAGGPPGAAPGQFPPGQGAPPQFQPPYQQHPGYGAPPSQPGFQVQ